MASPLDRNQDEISPLIEIPDDEVNIDASKHRWTLIPDGDGRMHMIDLNSYQTEIAPQFTAENDVFFMLYTNRNPTDGQRIGHDANGIRNSNFNPGAPTRFVIHGWNNDHKSNVNILITAAYLKNGEFNVIVVDWGAGANTIDYIAARNRINDVARFTASFVDYLQDNGFISIGNLLIAGHSLGGHTAGITGKLVSRGKVKTIIGLDPAGPLFSTGSPAERISYDDASYVEIHHTNGWTLGFGEPLGQADFFPNFGKSQPGCGIDLTGSCAHSRAPEFFAESITSTIGFVSQRCTSFAEVDKGTCTPYGGTAKMGGEPPNSGLTGYFYASTNSASPFARG